MFTGIIESMGKLKAVSKKGTNLTFSIESNFLSELKIDQSVAHNGVCLTVDGLFDTYYTVTAIEETLNKTNLGHLKEGDLINLERCLKVGDRLDGHMVQGHIDSTAKITDIISHNGSWEFYIEYDPGEFITVSKGSIAVNGVSLTVVHSSTGKFSVAIIPYTFEHTNFGQLKKGDLVNLEFDILGKYILASSQAHLYKQ
jgi:riboflavin synthase